jgi:hypothetical protein
VSTQENIKIVIAIKDSLFMINSFTSGDNWASFLLLVVVVAIAVGYRHYHSAPTISRK